ncbi:hypothetical protein CTI12_AA131460 [Artemisia annua]|uniref:Alpha carbonic anhydrase 7 n=1 Tax=Artemisia annua TaxID=35608 RepID=A0A2U1PNN1_ARTAN|nr:hypothetical protein CTI12_AA131460 [Artemisia annua]
MWPIFDWYKILQYIVHTFLLAIGGCTRKNYSFVLITLLSTVPTVQTILSGVHGLQKRMKLTPVGNEVTETEFCTTNSHAEVSLELGINHEDCILLQQHMFQLRWIGGSGAGHIHINGTEYQLNQIHWHTATEHTIKGQRYIFICKQHDRVNIIANNLTPSYIGFTDTDRLIGHAAKNQVAMKPTNMVFGLDTKIYWENEDEGWVAGSCNTTQYIDEEKQSYLKELLQKINALYHELKASSSLTLNISRHYGGLRRQIEKSHVPKATLEEDLSNSLNKIIGQNIFYNSRTVGAQLYFLHVMGLDTIVSTHLLNELIRIVMVSIPVALVSASYLSNREILPHDENENLKTRIAVNIMQHVE